jgi:beta-lactamase class C
MMEADARVTCAVQSPPSADSLSLEDWTRFAVGTYSRAMRSTTAVLIAAFFACGVTTASAASDDDIAQIVARHARAALPDDGPGGLSVAVWVDGRTHFFNFGYAENISKHPVTSDTLFNLGSVGKVFDATLLAQAVVQGELSLDDPVANYVTELKDGADIRRITLGQLASHTSGLVLPQDHIPWPSETFTQPEFVAYLKKWQSDAEHEPGKQMIYAHSGYILLHLALERRFKMPFHKLMAQRILAPLGLHETTLPLPDSDTQAYPRGRIPPEFARRAVQGYDEDGEPVGEPGNLQGYYHWLGTGQMYSSAHDLASFLAANLGQLPGHQVLKNAMQLTHREVIPIDGHVQQAMAWEVWPDEPKLVDKYGGLNNASAFIAIVPARNAGVVLLANRGSMKVATAGRAILRDLAGN